MPLKKPIQSTLLLAMLCTGNAFADGIKVIANGAQPSVTGSSDYFSGAVVVDPLMAPAGDYSGVTGANVMFAPGARSAWHTHPRGQTLIVTSGTGWIQEWGKDKHVIKPGDVIQIVPGVKHWHGATSTQSMRHIAIQELLDGKNVEWLEQVSDAQYAK